MTPDSLLLFIVTGFIIGIDCDIIDFENADLLFDTGEWSSIHLVTEPTEQSYFDVLPPLPEATAQKFFLRFRVISESAAHVILAQASNRIDTYHIVFGAHRNNYVSIRKCVGDSCTEMARALMPDAVILDKARAFWIAYDHDVGLVQAGRGGDSSPYIEWKDPTMLTIHEIGLSTWHGSVGNWWFPKSYVDSNCGSLIYHVDSTYSYHYTLPVIPVEFAMEFEFEFYVQALADARILLASEVGLADNDAAYEIVIGSSSNTESEIRRCNNAVECCPALQTASTPQILNEWSQTKFFIRYRRGLIKVFTDVEQIPFLIYQDQTPIAVRAIAYSSGPHNDATFEFPVKGILVGNVVFETKPRYKYRYDLPLVPDHNSNDIDLEFLARASSNVMIGLSPTIANDGLDGWFYEILIGGHGNRKTVIRRCKLCQGEVRLDHHPLDVPLDENQFIYFRITYRAGTITVQRRDDAFPMMAYSDPNPLTIKDVGFTSRHGVSMTVLFPTCNIY
ncbi:uncharacterized protein [Diadema setosum]|uniref:uncharacterized protein n=1 Tax=Diadema setosum TaxID=31175 RepID=UPI003B39FEFA